MLQPTRYSCSPKLIEQLCQSLRDSRYSSNSVETYSHWVSSYIHFHGFRHPINMGAMEVRQFLTYLVNEHRISYTTYIHALCALLYLYKKLLRKEIGWIDNGPPPACPRKLSDAKVPAKAGKQLEMPLTHLRANPPAAISCSQPPEHHKKSKIGQMHSFAPGSERNCHAA
ncbi:integrase-like protein [Paucimonas lemoignei]|uniref:Integrase-like protein n=1 Tax=Paucimonas lemoignei TaxID=29443 RepID=A0A4R3I1E4_PAULE|nr:integrase-like protein [Paucimonas lemoignei]